MTTEAPSVAGPAVLKRSLDTLAGLVLESGRTWGETAERWQWDDAAAILDPDGEVSQNWLTRPRGGRKTTDLAGVVLALLLEQAPPAARCYGGASDEDQAAELVDAAAGLIERTSRLRGAFWVTGLKVTNRSTGATFEALPMDASAMGKRAWLIVLDEVSNWPDTRRARRFWGVLTSGNRKLPDCRTVVITNAGVPEHWAHTRRETAAVSRNWRLSEVPGPLPWLSERDVEVLRENAETDSEFDRLHLNLWVSAEDALAAREDVEACATLSGPMEWRPGFTYCLGLDMGTVRDRAVAVVAHQEPPGRVWDPQAGGWRVNERHRLVVDRLRVWTPDRRSPVSHSEVEEWVRGTALAYRATVNYDPSEVRGMTERLRAEGVRCEQFTFSQASVGKLGVTLHNLIRDRAVELPDDAELVDELVHVRLRRTGPGQYRLDHDSGRHDDRAVALALAAHWLLTVGSSLPSAPQIVSQPRWAVLAGRGR